jgi:hypothetical protein
MKVAAAFVASLGLASAFMAPAPKFGRSRGMVKASVEDLIGASRVWVLGLKWLGTDVGGSIGWSIQLCLTDSPLPIPTAGIDVETGGLFDPLNFSKVRS